MASIATFVNRFVGARELELADRLTVRTTASSCRLRPLANEDVYLYVKRIDNTAVVRAADPAVRRACTRTVVMGFAAAMLVIAGLFPAAYNTMEGYQIQTLRQEQVKLKSQRADLELQEAKLVNPKRLEQLAEKRLFADPAPQKLVYLEGKDSAFAMNRSVNAEAKAVR